MSSATATTVMRSEERGTPVPEIDEKERERAFQQDVVPAGCKEEESDSGLGWSEWQCFRDGTLKADIVKQAATKVSPTLAHHHLTNHLTHHQDLLQNQHQRVQK
jgi:hypothetical protein